MSPKERELRQKLQQKREAAKKLLEEGKIDEARALITEAEALVVEIESIRSLEGLHVPVGAAPSVVGTRNTVPIEDAWNGGAKRDLPEDGLLTRSHKLLDLAEPFTIDGEKRKLSIGKLVRGSLTGEWKDADAEKRAMSEGALAGGGYMVPAELSAQILDLARNQARVMAAGAITIPMDSSKLTIAKVIQDLTPHWKKENEPITESEMNFGAADFEAKTLVGMCRLSVELLEDAANIDSVIINNLAESLGLQLDWAALFGTGIDPEPLGVYNTPGIQTIDMGANGAAIANYSPFSRAVQMIQQVNGNANGIIWNPRTSGDIDRLADGNGNPMIPPASFVKTPNYVTNQIPVDLTHGTALNASAALVGDWSKLYIGMRTRLQLEVSREAAGAFEKLQVVIRAYLRADVQAVKPDHFVAIKGILPTA